MHRGYNYWKRNLIVLIVSNSLSSIFSLCGISYSYSYGVNIPLRATFWTHKRVGLHRHFLSNGLFIGTLTKIFLYSKYLAFNCQIYCSKMSSREDNRHLQSNLYSWIFPFLKNSIWLPAGHECESLGHIFEADIWGHEPVILSRNMVFYYGSGYLCHHANELFEQGQVNCFLLQNLNDAQAIDIILYAWSITKSYEMEFCHVAV